MKYNLCISIPIKYTSINEVTPIIDKAIKSKPNLIELRFDYISKIKTLSILSVLCGKKTSKKICAEPAQKRKFL